MAKSNKTSESRGATVTIYSPSLSKTCSGPGTISKFPMWVKKVIYPHKNPVQRSTIFLSTFQRGKQRWSGSLRDSLFVAYWGFALRSSWGVGREPWASQKMSILLAILYIINIISHKPVKNVGLRLYFLPRFVEWWVCTSATRPVPTEQTASEVRGANRHGYKPEEKHITLPQPSHLTVEGWGHSLKKTQDSLVLCGQKVKNQLGHLGKLMSLSGDPFLCK